MPRKTVDRRSARNVGAKPRVANATADRAIDTLLAFTEERPIWSTLELSDHFGMPRSTMYRYLSTLRGVGLIAEDEAGRYRLGPRILQLARVAKQQQSVLRIAAPVIADLNRRFNETVILNEKIGHEMVMLERVDTRHSVAASALRGQILPWPAAASAKVLLAFADAEDREAMLRLMKPVRYTPKTITSRAALRSALTKIQKQGYAVGDEELEIGVRGIAVPIFVGDECRFSLSIAVPSFRLPDDKLPEMIEMLKAAAIAVTKGMGEI